MPPNNRANNVYDYGYTNPYADQVYTYDYGPPANWAWDRPSINKMQYYAYPEPIKKVVDTQDTSSLAKAINKLACGIGDKAFHESRRELSKPGDANFVTLNPDGTCEYHNPMGSRMFKQSEFTKDGWEVPITAKKVDKR